ncbi:unnamed protein product [Mytilus coruscus]|uniref:Uncharacterized protein n=1 Tax=Mytilus coruscus TaxID=42192 RepID=A0A6J8CDG7_MYTCO|nr:unnamed protein product [Mytilus coruscus]
MLDSTKPDSIFGTETWIDSSIKDSQIFPQGYNKYRDDRNLNGRGVIVAVRDNLISSPVTEIQTECKMVKCNLELKIFVHVLKGHAMSKFKFRYILIIGFFFVATYIVFHKTNTFHEYVDANFKHTEPGEKPYIVLGIFSANGRERFRKIQRETWIDAMVKMQQHIPFRITYKFLINNFDKGTIKENIIYKDILSLNVTPRGGSINVARKMHIWMNHIQMHYPNALLGAKLDDETFMCVPQIFYRLDNLKSPNLCFSYNYKKLNKTNIYKDINELFVVLGRDIIARIANGIYCTKDKCSTNSELLDTNLNGVTSQAKWITGSSHIDLQGDIQCRPNENYPYVQYSDSNLCRTHLIFHKSTYNIMVRLQKYNDFLGNKILSTVTGSVFLEEEERYIPRIDPLSQYSYLAKHDNFVNCNKWAVVTTTCEPSKAVRHIANCSDWCLIVVADIQTPNKNDYLKNFPTEIVRRRMKYLSILEQSILYPLLSDVIPFKHFARKNIGYMYAIHHKAKFIWDFDDDNIGIVDTKHLGDTLTICQNKQSNLMNPYPYFGVNDTWPRGFPLQLIKDEKTLPTHCYIEDRSNTIQVGVIQSLVNNQPDVDAIYRLTRNVPFNFSTKNSGRILCTNKYAPFNAQATLWISPAFLYIGLPNSVNGSVSDIWRSYIAQYFLHKKNVSVAFTKPYVTRERNSHNVMEDFNEETVLYDKSYQLVQFLLNTRSYDLTELYENLYKRNFIEISDLQFIKAWTQTYLHVIKNH